MMKLYTYSPAHFFYYNAKMTADYCGFPVQVVIADEEMKENKEFKAKKGHLSFPFLETPDGKIIGESIAISGFIARAAGQQAFLGEGAFEQAQVEQWNAFTGSTLTPHVKKIASHYWGFKVDAEGCKAAEKELKNCARIMNQSLQGKSWLVGERLTLADIVAFNMLIVAFTFSFDAGVAKAFPNLASWFAKMSKLPVVARTAGYIKMQGGAPQAQAAAAAGGQAKEAKGGKAKGGKQEKQEAKPKAETKPAPKEDADEFDPFADDDEEDGENDVSILFFFPKPECFGILLILDLLLGTGLGFQICR